MRAALSSNDCAQQVRDAAVRSGADNDAFEYFKHVFPLLCAVQLQVAQDCGKFLRVIVVPPEAM